MLLTGAEIIIRSLIDQDVKVLFGYPGGQVLNIYDALYDYRDKIRHILVSHEQGATHAADGYARSTGKTGVVLATSGPGATNLVTGLATAWHDSIPLVAITGNVPHDLLGRNSFQEVDIIRISKPVVKQNFFVDDIADLAQTIHEAFVTANSGRKGPVLIDIPKDVTAQKIDYTPLPRFAPREHPQPTNDQIAHIANVISSAKRPLIYCGGGVTFTDCAEKLQVFARHIQAPVCASMMGISSLPPDCELYLGLVGMHGTPTANMAVSGCDLLIAVGARFSDRVAGNRTRFAENAQIIHIDIDENEISKNVPADLSLIGDAGECLERLTAALPKLTHPEWVHKLLRSKALNALPLGQNNGEFPNPREIIRTLHNLAGPDAIIVTDVGQHQMLVAQYYPFSRPRSLISSCGLGTMGFGMGAANGAAVGNPNRKVILVTGDGSFHMNLAELAVAVTEQLDITVLIMNNGVLGMVHQWQSLFYRNRYSFTCINRKTQYPQLAEAFGATGFTLAHAKDIRPVLAQALAVKGPCVVDCHIDFHDKVYPIIPPGGAEEDMIYTDEPHE